MCNDWILATFLVVVCALLVRPSDCGSPAANVTGTAVATGEKFECYPYRPSSPALDKTAPVMDCARALLQFPKNAPPVHAEKARFQQIRGGSPHRYVLPKTRYGPASLPNNCFVQVEVIETPQRSDETSSWSAITATASLLIQACSIPGTGAVGGWTLAGDDENMRITIGNSRHLRETLANSAGSATKSHEADYSGLVLPAFSSGEPSAAPETAQ
ncbi:MAG: hypothetical protein HETSPECPRED_005263 [Heterodermia speciosa]|uniref:Secreted protein n=1 Tax=Heterodermia speciosa TaxID=116794 RepID=A0A8H3FI27_9LECA|nr:MAG: hypothetical protein HETSPECPRED_005263 [Heterodermia speciosa]